jgi:putative hemolysin
MNKGHIAAAFAAVLAVGCTTTETEYTVESWEAKTDPAVMYCVEQEGKFIRMSEGENRVGYCVFSEDEKYEIQEYYQRHLDEQESES